MTVAEVPDREELDALRRRAYGVDGTPLTAAESRRLEELERSAQRGGGERPPRSVTEQPSCFPAHATGLPLGTVGLDRGVTVSVPPRPPLPAPAVDQGSTGATAMRAGAWLRTLGAQTVTVLDRTGGLAVAAWQNHRRAVVTLGAICLTLILAVVVTALVRSVSGPTPDAVLTGTVVPASERPSAVRQADFEIYLGFKVEEWVAYGEYEGREVWLARSPESGVACILTLERWTTGESHDQFVSAVACGNDRLPAVLSLMRNDTASSSTPSALYFDSLRLNGDTIHVFSLDARSSE